MSDQITEFVRYNNEDGTCHRYEVTFSFDGVEVPVELRTVYLGAPTLTDPNDINEVKTKACQLASNFKKLYSLAVPVTELVGPVTL